MAQASSSIGRNILVIMVLTVLSQTVSACGTSGGGGGIGGSIGAPGTACNPTTSGEVCLGSARMQCDPNLTVWTQLAVCPQGSSCVFTTATTTYCTAVAADTTSSTGSDASGSDTGSTIKDSGGSQTDVAPADVAKDITAPTDTAVDPGPDVVEPSDTGAPPTGAMTIADSQKGSVNCPSPDPQTWNSLPQVTITDALVVSAARKLAADGSTIGLYVQQGAGQWSGMMVMGSKDGPLATLQLGDVVTLTGDVKDYYCLTEMYVTAATTISTGSIPKASTVTLYQVGDGAGATQSEPWEGTIVELKNLVASGDALGTDGKPHGDFWVGMTNGDQGLRVGATFPGVYTSTKQPDGTYTPKYPAGTKLSKVRGVVDYNFGTYRLLLTEDPVVAP